MSEIAGILNLKRDISDDVSIRKMSKIQELNATNNCGMFLSKECNLIKNSFKNENKKVNVYTCGESRYVILIDGEFYNLKELKVDLCGCHSCQSCTDEEIILNLYSKYGKRICQYLNGVYVIVIWDDREKELFILRDRFGIKPFYYCFKDDNFIFASSIKTILESGKIDAVLNEEGKVIVGTTQLPADFNREDKKYHYVIDKMGAVGTLMMNDTFIDIMDSQDYYDEYNAANETELKAATKGYFVIKGKVSRRYLSEQIYGMSAN